eukprot:TRINITY_DN17494_c0_g1_i1.p1 TRINITY_DN17494_c0_g1~~TRINITY_DN17494_c0_g1_i1.p1  ORF type:complete len:617 (+),score=241.29 TRINITY_DN17494_c0_g1_i1:57-1907(+)
MAWADAALSGTLPHDGLDGFHSPGDVLDDQILFELAGMVQQDAPTAQSAQDSLPPASQTPGIESAGSCDVQGGCTNPTAVASEAEVLQARAESIVATLGEAHSLKLQNPFRGLAFEDLIQRLSLNPSQKVYSRKVPPHKATQGTVAEQLVAVADSENERYMSRVRKIEEQHAARFEAMEQEHKDALAALAAQNEEAIAHLHDEYGRRIERSKENLKGQTEVLAREGLQSQLESERAKDQVSLLNEDVSSLKKLLFFWKKKNGILKQHYDQNERELDMAREKLKDYQQIHEMDVYKVHRYCGQLREKEMKAKWRADELERELKDTQQSLRQVSEERTLLMSTTDGTAAAAKSPLRIDPQNDEAYYAVLESVTNARLDVNSLRSPGSEYMPDKKGVVEAAVVDGVRLRDEQIDVLLSSVEFRDTAIKGLQADLAECTKTIADLRQKVCAGTAAEALAEENASLLQQVSDVKDIMYSMQRQLKEERADMAKERVATSDRELKEAKAVKEREAALAEQLREKEMEIIRLRSRLQSAAGGTLSSETELLIIKADQETADMKEQLDTAEEEKSRLKVYIASLSSRLEQALTQLASRTEQIKQYEALTSEIALSPRVPEASAR